MRPVATLVPYEGSGAKSGAIAALNAGILQACLERKIPCIDLNPIISRDGRLLPEFSHADGVHLNEKAYAVSAQLLKDKMNALD